MHAESKLYTVRLIQDCCLMVKKLPVPPEADVMILKALLILS